MNGEDELYTLRALRHASERLRELSKRQQRLLDNWYRLDDVHRRDEFLAIKTEFDDAITTIINWPVWAEANGLIPPEDKASGD